MKNPRETVVDWLSQRAGLKREKAREIPDEIITDIIRDPRGALTKLLGKEPKAHRVSELQSLLSKAVQQVAAPTPAQPERASSAAEHVETKGLETALREAKTLKLITTQEGGDTASPFHCYLLASGHYSGPNTEQSIQRSQYELFALAHIFKKHGVTNPLYVEGLGVRETCPKDFPVRFGPFAQTTFGDPAFQQYLFEHPAHFSRLLHQKAEEGGQPTFYEVSAYPHIHGIHQDHVLRKVQSVVANTSIGDRFQEKYVSAAGMQPSAEIIQGKRMIRFKGRLYDPMEIIRDCDAFIQCSADLDEVDALREEEVVERFLADKNQKPMAWVGLGHERSILALCKERGLHVTSIIPTATIPARQRGESGALLKANLPNLGALRSGVVPVSVV